MIALNPTELRRQELEEAKALLQKSKTELANVSILENRIYEDPEAVSNAAESAYRACLKAVNAYLLHIGTDYARLPAEIYEYGVAIDRLNCRHRLIPMLTVAYQNLHLFGYHRKAVSVDLIKAGIRNAEDVLKLMEQLISKGDG
ncbi:MAG: DUF5618 family protein [Bacteroidia bacterium]|nr:DUF5618 family protein [Bacteroidia bacterium]MDW8333137.1 DUF5618 family protein [Bacteroidia bacterium]